MSNVNNQEEMTDKYVKAITALLNTSIAERNIVIPSLGFVRVRMNRWNVISNDIIRAAVDLADSTGGSVSIERASGHIELVVAHGVECEH